MTPYSAVLIVPAALIDNANALGDCMGYGPESYSVPLSGDGEAVTHYGSRARAQTGFLAALAAAGAIPQSEWPDLGLDGETVQAAGAVVQGLDLAAYGLTEADRDEVIAALVYDIKPEGSVVPAQQFDAACSALNVTRI